MDVIEKWIIMMWKLIMLRGKGIEGCCDVKIDYSFKW